MQIAGENKSGSSGFDQLFPLLSLLCSVYNAFFCSSSSAPGVLLVFVSVQLHFCL